MHTRKLDWVQNLGMRTILGTMKSTLQQCRQPLVQCRIRAKNSQKSSPMVKWLNNPLHGKPRSYKEQVQMESRLTKELKSDNAGILAADLILNERLI